MARPNKKANDARISRLYSKHCHGIQVHIMKLGSITKKADAALAANPAISDDELGAVLNAAALEVANS